MKSKYLVIENFIQEKDLSMLKMSSAQCLNHSTWIRKRDYHCVHKEALNALLDFLDDKDRDTLLVEEWAFHNQFGPMPCIHQDKDEELFDEDKTNISYPIGSCVLYLSIEDMEGGRLFVGEVGGEEPEELNDEYIVPKSGMLVLMVPELWHRVEQVTKGKRHSINYNYWEKPVHRIKGMGDNWR